MKVYKKLGKLAHLLAFVKKAVIIVLKNHKPLSRVGERVSSMIPHQPAKKQGGTADSDKVASCVSAGRPLYARAFFFVLRSSQANKERSETIEQTIRTQFVRG